MTTFYHAIGPRFESEHLGYPSHLLNLWKNRDLRERVLVVFLPLLILFFPLLFHQQYVLDQRHEHERKRAEQEVVDGLKVRYFRHVVVHGASHETYGQHGGYSQAHAVRAFAFVDPEADPGEDDDTDAGDVHLEDKVDGTPLELDGGR